MTKVARRSWAETYRQNWMAETLRVFGFIQRKHLCLKFGISRQQAALDFRRFNAERPGQMTYDAKAKTYVTATIVVERD